MNKYLQAVLLFVIIIILELTPFLYRESYSLSEMNWPTAVVISVGVLAWINYQEKKTKKQEN
ncbi:MAG: hypothetical protein JKX79_02950 [Labilibaculum sp.]|nr:hypothetical protein [Labilibaculum sp.]